MAVGQPRCFSFLYSRICYHLGQRVLWHLWATCCTRWNSYHTADFVLRDWGIPILSLYWSYIRHSPDSFFFCYCDSLYRYTPGEILLMRRTQPQLPRWVVASWAPTPRRFSCKQLEAIACRCCLASSRQRSDSEFLLPSSEMCSCLSLRTTPRFTIICTCNNT